MAKVKLQVGQYSALRMGEYRDEEDSAYREVSSYLRVPGVRPQVRDICNHRD